MKMTKADLQNGSNGIMLDVVKFFLLLTGLIGVPLVWVAGVRLYSHSAQLIFYGMAKLPSSELERFGWPSSADVFQDIRMRPLLDKLVASLHTETYDRPTILGKFWVWGLPACNGISIETRRAARRYRVIRTSGTLLFFGVLPFVALRSFGASIMILAFIVLVPPDKLFPWKQRNGSTP
ncbi:hypothetical protein KUV26_10350 [Leisingera daeponensis]|uniref:Uncharacterized protein n=1 Tax=Leisingera daeponensis TaxID=405746 RepID=A0ABS7NF95_9RHOB|nr:hypothetical protein [Leisingera daeponensis]MBY6139835.1 hypothetical protein [Leisingera daeponensis]